MVGSFFGGPGGNLVFNVDVGVPFDVEVSINPTGNVRSSTGQVTVSGSVSCSTPEGVSIDGRVTQRAGRVTIQAFFSEFTFCEGGEEPSPWSATFEGENGRFVAGRASVTVTAFGCNPVSCDFDQESTTVRLKGSR